MKTLRRSTRGEPVRLWQNFLLGLGLRPGIADGIFGPLTDAATEKFQRLQGLEMDGIVGPITYGRAMQLGFDPIEPDKTDKSEKGPNWPVALAGLKSPSPALREKLFGKFSYKPAGTANNPEAIKILGAWQRNNIVRVTIPQLKGVAGAHPKGHVFFHRKGADALVATFQGWEDAGLLPLVKTWAGSFVPRFIRGSRTTLSNHAFGTAFDINAQWNWLGSRPALANKTGSVRRLVPIAQKHGFAWGGNYKKRPDGMHFELVRPT